MLETVLDLIPEEHLPWIRVFRVKARDNYTKFGQIIFMRPRYVVVRKDGYIICTCLQSRNLGITCCHELGVMLANPEFGFHISFIHPHWIFPSSRTRIGLSEVVYLRPRSEPPIGNTATATCGGMEEMDEGATLGNGRSDDGLNDKQTYESNATGKEIMGETRSRQTVLGDEEETGFESIIQRGHDPLVELRPEDIFNPFNAGYPPQTAVMQSFDGRFNTPAQPKTQNRRNEQYGKAMSLFGTMFSMAENDPVRVQQMLNLMAQGIHILEDQNRTLAGVPPTTPRKAISSNLGALMTPGRGQTIQLSESTPTPLTRLPADPVPTPAVGRKRESRLKSWSEKTEKGKRKKRKNEEEKDGG